MELSSILMAVAIIAVIVGIRLMFDGSNLHLFRNKGSGPSVTISGKSGIITVRNAAGGDLQVFVGSQGSGYGENLVPMVQSEDRQAEEEVTILDELRSPDTSPARKREIEAELLALGYRISRRGRKPKQKAVVTSGEGADNKPERKPSSGKPSEKNDSDTNSQEPTDEGLEEQDPLLVPND